MAKLERMVIFLLNSNSMYIESKLYVFKIKLRFHLMYLSICSTKIGKTRSDVLTVRSFTYFEFWKSNFLALLIFRILSILLCVLWKLTLNMALSMFLRTPGMVLWLECYIYGYIINNCSHKSVHWTFISMKLLS